jgi:cobalamin biosynthesis Mg chelatase CobN
MCAPEGLSAGAASSILRARSTACGVPAVRSPRSTASSTRRSMATASRAVSPAPLTGASSHAAPTPVGVTTTKGLLYRSGTDATVKAALDRLHDDGVIVYFIVTVVFVVVLIGIAWWALRRALNGDQEPTAGGSFGDLVLGDKNTRKQRKRRK